MWVIIVIFLLPDAYKVSATQMIYQDKRICELKRTELYRKFTTTAPVGGKVLVRCVDMSGGLVA
tara:strand:+ start:2206 stop:2397 length:192 start_codon:yes stop_codon:yes gene_type:complete